MQKVDLSGQVFSLLTVLEEVPPINGKKRYKCQCACGNVIEKSYANLKGHKGKQSCGCMAKKWQAEAKITHGGRYTRLYNIWQGVKSRSINSGSFLDRLTHSEYKRKNITICQEWLNFETFSLWANSNGYVDDPKLSIDRIDNEKGYYPENCRWTTANIQARNTKQISASNTTGYRGVSITKRKTNPYRALIYVDTKQISLGSFSTALEAAVAYDTYVISNNLEHTLNNVTNHAQWEIQQTAKAIKQCLILEKFKDSMTPEREAEIQRRTEAYQNGELDFLSTEELELMIAENPKYTEI